MPDDTSAPLQSAALQDLIQKARSGDFLHIDGFDADWVMSASNMVGGDHFGISDQNWLQLEEIVRKDEVEKDKSRRADLDRKLQQDWQAKAMQDATERMRSLNKPSQPPPVPPPLPLPPIDIPSSIQSGASYDAGHDFDWRSHQAPPPVDPGQQERDRVIQDVLTPPVTEETGVELLSTHSMEPVEILREAAPDVRSNGGGPNNVLIGGGIAALLLVGAVIFVVFLSGQLKPASPASSPVAAVKSPVASAAPVVTQASAMIGGIGENNTKDPALVVCQIRGTVLGMEFRGTLSGKNIGSHAFDIKSGEPSQGVTPVSPYEAVFAVPFPGMGGQHGGGPLPPYTCTLTSVVPPAGTQLAPNESGWTMVVN